MTAAERAPLTEALVQRLAEAIDGVTPCDIHDRNQTLEDQAQAAAAVVAADLAAAKDQIAALLREHASLIDQRDAQAAELTALRKREITLINTVSIHKKYADDKRDLATTAEAALSAATQRERALREALKQSVKLQSHYAVLLNGWDGGERRTFTADSWLARLAELTERGNPHA